MKSAFDAATSTKSALAFRSNLRRTIFRVTYSKPKKRKIVIFSCDPLLFCVSTISNALLQAPVRQHISHLGLCSEKKMQLCSNSLKFACTMSFAWTSAAWWNADRILLAVSVGVVALICAASLTFMWMSRRNARERQRLAKLESMQLSQQTRDASSGCATQNLELAFLKMQGCPHCTSLSSVAAELRQSGIAVREIDVTELSRDWLIENKVRGFPTICVLQASSKPTHPKLVAVHNGMRTPQDISMFWTQVTSLNKSSNSTQAVV